MKVSIVAGDITRFEGDVIVNAANPVMLGGGGVDGAIHRAAGPVLRASCLDVWADENGVRCPVGHVRPTPAFLLKCKWVFHTSGPIFRLRRSGPPHAGENPLGDENPDQKLMDCFQRAGAIAVAMGLKSIAFPAISTGVYGCPQETCAAIAAKWVTRNSAWPLEVTFYIHPAEHLGTWIRAMNDAGVNCDVFHQK